MLNFSKIHFSVIYLCKLLFSMLKEKLTSIFSCFDFDLFNYLCNFNIRSEKMYLSFDSLIQYYKNAKDSNLSASSPENLYPIKDWLRCELGIETGKNIHKSATLRKQGNMHFKEKNLRKSTEFYNMSICCAPETSEEYFLAVANRSAVSFELERFEDCLKDIESCLNSIAYPEKLRPKIYARKNLCLNRLGMSPEKTSSRESYASSQTENHKSLINTNMYKIPLFEEGENPNFAFASSKIHVKYDNVKGRHVVAKKSIKKGDILFIEKAFAFGGIFDECSRTLNMLKCYYCLKITYSGIPCKYCAKCIFCNSQCRNESWEQSHKWECKGMLGDIWYHLGIAFPAFRALLKGVNSNFEKIEKNDVIRFGSKKDNYPFFNSLVYDEFSEHLEVLIMTVIVSVYLKEYTKFFNWLQTQLVNVNRSIEEIIKFFEIRLGKHILQFQNNSSIIEHWLEDELLPSEKEPVACGIFPSVSMMNHACKPNITNYFVCDTIVVKALTDIKENEEISNCYGIYYRDMCKNERIQNCLQLYNFECKCMICLDPTKEVDVFDRFICHHCGFNIINNEENLCRSCGEIVDSYVMANMLHKAEVFEGRNNIDSLNQSLDIRKKILHRYHSILQNTYFKLYRLYKEKENYELALNYFEEWFRVEKIKIEEDIQLFGMLLYEISSCLLSKLDTADVKNEKMILKAKKMMNQAIAICTLHYPSHIIARISSMNFDS